jgi:hypothetical protein
LCANLWKTDPSPTGMQVATTVRMASGWSGGNDEQARLGDGRDHRQSPRVEVLMRLKGKLVAPDTPILVHDLSRSGFAVLSRLAFTPGQTLDFRLTGDDGLVVKVKAQAIHSQQMPAAPDLHLSGFMFVAGPLTGLVPQALIDHLITTVAATDTPCYFERD